jgi:hypothetical protein
MLLGIDALRLMIATIAHHATSNRHAQRVANRLATVEQVEAVVQLLQRSGFRGGGHGFCGFQPEAETVRGHHLASGA